MVVKLRKIGIQKIIVFLIGVASTQVVYSQSENPVSWNNSYERSGDEVVLTFTASIEEGWHLYALELPSNEGPIPTAFVFDESDAYTREGDVVQEEPHSAYDPNFDMDILYFEQKADFVQSITLKNERANINGYITFMVCNDDRCLPPSDYNFNIIIE